MNINDQLDKIISNQLKNVHEQLKNIPEGEQKEFLKQSINKIKEERTLDPIEFVNQFSRIKGERIDFEKLSEMAKKIKV
tara:strand:- start:189 stop:425 length:237 start_codon:yes stop_codon:yes gene_type:complete